jgi:hypothetical protein
MISPEVRCSHNSQVRVSNASQTAQKRLRDLKGKISAQSKKNFVLERDVRYLDSRIALLIQNRMAADEVRLPVPLSHSIFRLT